MIFANFSEQEQVITARVMEQHNCLSLQQIYGSSRVTHQKGLTLTALDLVVLQSCS